MYSHPSPEKVDVVKDVASLSVEETEREARDWWVDTPLCKKCGRRLNSAGNDWCCTVCGDVFPKLQTPHVVMREKPAQPRKPEQWRGSEAELVEAIRDTLKSRGWMVYRVGQHIVKGSGSDAGVPDLLCILPAYGRHPAIVRLLEVKVAPNKPTAEQQEIIDIGGAAAVYSVQEALEALGEIC